MGWYDKLTGAEEKQRSIEILREKFPHTRGLSAETMEAVAAGELEIVADDPEEE